MPWHDGQTCEEYREGEEGKRERLRGEEVLTEREVERVTKACPKCGVRIWKGEGCEHMTCECFFFGLCFYFSFFFF